MEWWRGLRQIVRDLVMDLMVVVFGVMYAMPW